MEAYVDYVNRSLPRGKETRMLYDYKNQIIGEMSKRADELEARGLKDEKVINDLIISEYPDLGKDFLHYVKKKTAARKAGRSVLFNVLFTAAYLIVVVSAYLAISFSTRAWGQTWVIMVDGAILPAVYYIYRAADKFAQMRRVFHWFARLFMASDVMLLTICVFLFAIGVLQLPKSWLIIILGVAIMMLADGIFASSMGEPLVIFSWLSYIPAVAAMLFIVICAAGIVPWTVGWILVPASLIFDVAIIVIRVIRNSKHREEVQDPWKEN